VKWDKDLTGPHLAIARTDDTPLRVVAGPGTGKTFALMRRVTRLLETGSVNPNACSSAPSRGLRHLISLAKSQGSVSLARKISGPEHSTPTALDFCRVAKCYKPPAAYPDLCWTLNRVSCFRTCNTRAWEE
jgi:hypothetical protein